MAVYCLACIYYIVMTRNIGTPFRDSLNENQLKIKMESSGTRRNIFYQGAMIGLLSMLVFRPFKSC
jgi:hypothetical protein